MVSKANKSNQALNRKLYALAAHEDDMDVKAMDRAYGILTILDDKAGGLMTVNAFLGAIPAFSIDHYKNIANPDRVSAFALWLSVAILIGLILSALLCFFVVRVKWPFFHFVKPDGGENFCKEEMAGLAKVINDRTVNYRRAWWFTLCCLIGMFVLAMLYVWR
jgi:hypothetical protein